MLSEELDSFLKDHQNIFPIVNFNPATEKVLPFDFTESNAELTGAIVSDTALFSEWVVSKLKEAGSRYGVGGYNEHRTIYSRSSHFDSEEEPRRLHLGVDIWGKAGTEVFCPLKGKVHSFKNNNNYGDYGATIILEHQAASGSTFFSLYGHLSLDSILNLEKDIIFNAGDKLVEFGIPEENGQWPPHLHFQLILDMKGMEGDYPGVCRFTERHLYLSNSPNPYPIIKRTFNG